MTEPEASAAAPPSSPSTTGAVLAEIERGPGPASRLVLAVVPNGDAPPSFSHVRDSAGSRGWTYVPAASGG